MIPLLRYHSALLLRSHRWLPPVLLYAAFLAVGVQSGGPVLDSYGLASFALLPLAAWLCRICVTGEPPAARACAAAATGPGRAHLARVATGALSAGVLALAGTAYVALVADPHASDHRTAVPEVPAFCAGLLAALVCVLLGTAVGALCNWPVLRSTGWSILSALMAAVLLLVGGASPANAAVSGLITGSVHGTVTLPWLPLISTAVIAAAATAVACRLSSRRS
ncbi:ABC transporter [Streptomyces albofaciens JCM 4342]|uniref:ABC transporter n=1 Tax=Streptomyces albofaciens TaxID=66866 RepID=UPI0012398FB7|nr:ABC transporter [Streptomyces albofaciens]KAA6213310.1 ABC transporter [Streptomyces albofaciens JCM 4342]